MKRLNGGAAVDIDDDDDDMDDLDDDDEEIGDGED
jgi:hypothetical protein